MGLSVREKADAVATWRFVAVALMEMLARWVPTAPELEVKALFGRHIWDLAQLADQLGHRTAELRAALHENRTPRADYQALLRAVDVAGPSGERMALLYDAVLPDLARRLEAARAAADPLLDEPTVRILERAQLDLRRMGAQRAALLVERAELAAHDAPALERTRAALAAVGDFVEARATAAAD